MKAKDGYDIVVIGGGVGGLNVTSAAARLGASVALVEKRKLGGDCLFHGCVPSKALIRTATSSYETRQAGRFGVLTDNIRVDYKRVMERLRDVIAKVGEHDSSERFREVGVDVFFGSGSFEDPYTFALDGAPLRGNKFVIATGSGPLRPDIPGLADDCFEGLLALAWENGFWEFYRPDSGRALGGRDFSWSAALTIDLLRNPEFAHQSKERRRGPASRR